MSTPPTASPAAEQPLDQFKDCHGHILTHLAELDELPALLAAAERARQAAAGTLTLFQRVMQEHHADEERELFPAVIASAADADERQTVRGICEQLTRDHREVEAAARRMLSALKDAARGRAATLDAEAVKLLVARYRGHAQYEEQVFLPLALQILSRQGHHMEALASSLHMRRAMPEVLSRFGHL